MNTSERLALALVIIHLRCLQETLAHRAHPSRPSRRAARDDADFPRVRIAADLRTDHRRKAEVPQRRRARVDELMRMVRADPKGHKMSCLDLELIRAEPQSRGTLHNVERLLVCEMVVERPRAFARRDLEHAASEFVGAGRLAQQLAPKPDALAVRKLHPLDLALMYDRLVRIHDLPRRCVG